MSTFGRCTITCTTAFNILNQGNKTIPLEVLKPTTVIRQIFPALQQASFGHITEQVYNTYFVFGNSISDFLLFHTVFFQSTRMTCSISVVSGRSSSFRKIRIRVLKAPVSTSGESVNSEKVWFFVIRRLMVKDLTYFALRHI